jgi:hypothetical protein
MGLDTQLLLRAVDAVQDAPDLDGVVGALAAALRARFDLWSVSACSLRAHEQHLQILASWSVADSVLTAGTAVATSLTPGIGALLEQAGQGAAVHTDVGNDPASIVDYLLSSQGIRQATLQTVDRDDSGMLFLVLGSGTAGLLAHTPSPFFAGLAAGIRPRVLELTHLAR